MDRTRIPSWVVDIKNRDLWFSQILEKSEKEGKNWQEIENERL